MIAQDLIDQFELFASPKIAWEHDPVGLQLGDPNREVKTVMTTLDVRPEVVDEAIEQKVDFIFAHHPMVFHPAKNLNLTDPQNAMYAQLIKHNIVVYGAHTNLDNANGGMNDWLAEQLGITQVQPLLDGGSDPVSGERYGMGRIGQLDQAFTPHEFANYCRERFGVTGVRLIDDGNKKEISKVAILGGAGGEFYLDALKQGADAYVTGDVSYHVGHDMIAHHLTVVDPGHHIEQICKPKLRALFQEWNVRFNWGIQVSESQLNTDPFEFITR